MIDAMQNILSLTRFSVGCLALLVTYVFIGLIVLPFAVFEYVRRPFPTMRDWQAAGEYSVAWLFAMFGLYACIGYVGVILSTILAIDSRHYVGSHWGHPVWSGLAPTRE